MRLKINSQMAKIGIRQQPLKASIQQPKAEVSIKNHQAKLKIKTKQPKVSISQKQAFSESGLKSIHELIREAAQRGMQAMEEFTSRTVEQGNQLADIHKSQGNVIAEQAEYNAFGKNKKEFGMVTMPKSGADISVDPGTVDIQVDVKKPDIQVKINKPIISYQKGKVEIYLRQQNKLDIQWEKDKFDMKG